MTQTKDCAYQDRRLPVETIYVGFNVNGKLYSSAFVSRERAEKEFGERAEIRSIVLVRDSDDHRD